MKSTSSLRSLHWVGAIWAIVASSLAALPGTAPLTGDIDRSEEMRAGMERYLNRELVRAVSERGKHWKIDASTPAAYRASVGPNRERLRRIIGLVETRVAANEPAYVGTTARPARLAESDAVTVFAVRWQVYDDVWAEGLLLDPKGDIKARVVAVPDADQTPEAIAGLGDGPGVTAPFALRLAEGGCQVLVPAIVSRAATYSGSEALKRFTNQPHREWIYRQAYTFGRHLIGYEVDQILAAVDWFASQGPPSPRALKIGVAGWGEGGLLALYSAAVEPRIDAALVSGHFGPREQLWQEPIYRNYFGLLREFGDAEIAALISPRVLLIEPAPGPAVAGPPAAVRGQRAAAAPGRIWTPPFATIRVEFERARKLADRFAGSLRLLAQPAPDVLPLRDGSLRAFVQALTNAPASNAPESPLREYPPRTVAVIEERQRRLVGQLEQHTQRLIARSREVRDEAFWKPVKLSTPAAWNAAMQPQRERFWNEINGRLPRSEIPLNVRSRVLYDRADSIGYEVVLDVLPDVTLWGYLLLPKDLAPGERRPLVVAQHGLSGLPADLINEDPASRAHRVYKAFATQLVQRGRYAVFVPHFPWRTGDDYRRLQRKANPLGFTIFSFILAHHGRLLDWLTEQPFVDPQRIGFYGLSWGGKVAMRVPALEPRYALSICSGDFNEWIWKNATTDWPNSYMFSGEADMFDFNLGMTFGHAEMGAMIAPRPFMVERGHGDGVGTDEMVAFEYARVRRLYNKLNVPRQTEIEFFDGVHEINAVGTFHFLQRHFNWPPTPSK